MGDNKHDKYNKYNIIFKDEVFDYQNTKLIELIPFNNWKSLFVLEEDKKSQSGLEIEKISDELRELSYTETILPPINKVFNIFYYLPLDRIKVVILGQDPYPKDNDAIGISFSVGKSNKKQNRSKSLNSSLRNIYNEIEDSLKIEMNFKNTSLIPWVEQGVFLYNTALTVKEGKTESHLDLWYEFSLQVIEYISKNRDDLVFMLWGAKAQKYKKNIDIRKHFVIETSHPSGFSNNTGSSPFTGSKCFLKANKFLNNLTLKKGVEFGGEINWKL